MKKYIVGFLVGVGTVAACFATERLTMANNAKLSATSGQIVECSQGGVTIFSDTVPAGYTLTGSISYQGNLAASQ